MPCRAIREVDNPIEETGGLNLYAFIQSGGVNNWDYLGLTVSKDDYCDWPEKTKDWLTKNGCEILNKANELRISPDALAMAMAEEYSRRGMSDDIQDSISNAGADLGNQITSALHGLKNGRNADLGPANINFDSAMAVRKEGEFLFHSGGYAQGLIEYLCTDCGSIDIGARIMQNYQKKMEPHLPTTMDANERTAILANAWREGADRLIKRIEENKKSEGEKYSPKSGNNYECLQKRSYFLYVIFRACECNMNPIEFEYSVIKGVEPDRPYDYDKN